MFSWSWEYPYLPRVFLVAATVTRIVLLNADGILVAPDLSYWMYHSRALSSVLVHPDWTVTPIREAVAMRSLAFLARRSRSLQSGSIFAETFSLGQVHVPPLVLAFFEGLESTNDWSRGVFLTVVDLTIAYLLESLSLLVIMRWSKATDALYNRGSHAHNDSQRDGYAAEHHEASMELRMPQSIRPELSHLLDMPIVETPSCQLASNGTKDSTENDGGVHTRPISLPKSPLIRLHDLPSFVSLLYYASPVTILASSCFKSAQNCIVLLILLAVWQSTQGSVVVAGVACSVGVYMDFHSVVFLVPATCCLVSNRRSGKRGIFVLVGVFAVFTCLLQVLSYLLVGRTVLWETHWYVFRIYPLEPSLSLLWYFSMEVFPRFRTYFTILFGGFPYILVVPVATRLYRFPLSMVCEAYSRCRPALLNSHSRCQHFFGEQAAVFWLLF
jgi:GPI transamidase subunit PIG-U